MLASNADTGNASDAIVAWLNGDVNGDGRDELVQVRKLNADGSNFEINIYGFTGAATQGNLQTLYTTGSSPIVIRAINNGWFIGDVNGDGKAELVQIVDTSNNSLFVAVYGWFSDSTGFGMRALPFNNLTSHSNTHLAFLMGDVNGDGRPELLKVFNSEGVVAIQAYSFGNDGLMVPTGTANGNQYCGPGAIAWLAADINGDDKTEVLQLWSNGSGSLGMIVYGWGASGAPNGMSVITSNSNLGAPSTSMAWLLGDVNGDGKIELVQPVDYTGKLGMHVHGCKADGSLAPLFSSTDLGPNTSPSSITWLIGNVNADGRADVVQLVDSGGQACFKAYSLSQPSGQPSNMQLVGQQQPLAPKAQTIAWLASRFYDRKVAGVLQLTSNTSGRLGISAFAYLTPDATQPYSTVLNAVPGAPAGSVAHDRLVWTISNRIYVANFMPPIGMELYVHQVGAEVGPPIKVGGGHPDLNQATQVAAIGNKVVSWYANRGVFLYERNSTTDAIQYRAWLTSPGMAEFSSIRFFTAVGSMFIAISNAGRVWRGVLSANDTALQFDELPGTRVNMAGARACAGKDNGFYLINTSGEISFYEINGQVLLPVRMGSADAGAKFHFTLNGELATLTADGRLFTYDQQKESAEVLTPVPGVYYNFKLGPLLLAVNGDSYDANVGFSLVLDSPDLGNRQFRIEDPNRIPGHDGQIVSTISGLPLLDEPGGSVLVARNSGKLLCCQSDGSVFQDLLSSPVALERVSNRSFRFRCAGGYLSMSSAAAGATLSWRSGAPNALSEFELVPVTVFRTIETDNKPIEFREDKAEKFMRMLVRDGIGEMIGSQIPGGSALYKATFDLLFPDPLYSRIEKLLQSFREDIMAEVRLLVDQSINQNNARLVNSAFGEAQVAYLGDYLKIEKRFLSSTSDTSPQWPRHYERAYNALWVALREFREALYMIEPDLSVASLSQQLLGNIELLRQGFALYLLAAVGYVNVLEEMAMLMAFHPSDSYQAFLDEVLRPQVQTLLAKINNMFAKLVDDRLRAVRVIEGESTLTPYGTWYTVMDDLVGKQVYKASIFELYVPPGHEPTRLGYVKRLYRWNIEVTFQKAKYPYHDAIQKITNVPATVLDFCNRIRQNTGSARADFMNTSFSLPS